MSSPFLQKIANYDWSLQPIINWFGSTFHYYGQIYGWVGAATFVLVVLFILTQIEFTKGIVNYLLKELVGTTLRNTITATQAGLVVGAVWLRSQLIARSRDAIRYFKGIF